MKRRSFLKNTALLSGLLVPSGFGFVGCGKDDNEPKPQQGTTRGSVAIIGAGIAGLQAAKELKAAGATVTIFEANNRIGGRIFSNSNWGSNSITLEMGAEEVHGQNSEWYYLLLKNGAILNDNANTNDYYYIADQLYDYEAAQRRDDFKRCMAFIDEIEEQTGAPDVPISAYLDSKGLAPQVKHIANALLGNENGTSINRISAAGLQNNNAKSTAGNKNFALTNKSFLEVLNTIYADVIPNISYNTPIAKINYEGSGVELTAAGGGTQRFDRVIVTIPLAVLRSNRVEFTPALPAPKLSAMEQLGMDAGGKVFMAFNSRFWPEDMGSLYSPEIPEYWVGPQKDGTFILTAFVNGERAESLYGRTAEETILADLSKIFNQDVRPFFKQSVQQNWGAILTAGGVYSYPKTSAANAHAILAEPINNKVFFAGEATNANGHNATVNGAYDTGRRVAAEVIQA